ncbi:MAG: aspartate kinase [Bacteroidota bacterium]
MLVMKFGGASVKDAPSIRNVAEIIAHHAAHPMLVVISASGKTTNHLEELAFLAKSNQEEATFRKLGNIRTYHQAILDELFGENAGTVQEKVNNFFKEIKRIVQGILLLEEFPPRTYDRIVSFGELLSTTIVAGYLQHQQKDCLWVDARELVKTDANYQAANVIWSLTSKNIQEEIGPQLQPGRSIITQGFIGSTISGKTTTLGREGSDYTASIFAHCLQAEKLMVWKDVRGILNADPRLRTDTIKIDRLSYEEAVEMTFYGASVIHPKTIKPIFNKQIPLLVKCFLDVHEDGTRISEDVNPEPITSYIVKKNQTFIHIKPKDFSFMDERLMQQIFNHVYKSGLKVNLVQTTAISMMLCVDAPEAIMEEFKALLLDDFVIETESELKLFTIMNFNIRDLKQAQDALMVQQNENKLYFVKREK